MNLSEFKAWFEGFTESMDRPPGEKAWKRIQDRIKSIKSDEPTARHVFHEYYERPWRRWYGYGPHWGDVVGIGASAVQMGLNGGQTALQVGDVASSMAIGSSQNAASGVYPHPDSISTVVDERFDAAAAFNKLGRAEALSLANVKTTR